MNENINKQATHKNKQAPKLKASDINETKTTQPLPFSGEVDGYELPSKSVAIHRVRWKAVRGGYAMEEHPELFAASGLARPLTIDYMLIKTFFLDHHRGRHPPFDLQITLTNMFALFDTVYYL
ncbi:unnamed protein product [Cuscuta epithymum]|uniref:Uncharacterized protein n=1 Tax=Cuscuta epithymum TaxID=186058 RepID=A0AAV0C102_9ASTE|nr:unnamed protein product [Cuscuta epithymum]CAH9123299.1 unnamed protein product [Cuscuta epithymum]